MDAPERLVARAVLLGYLRYVVPPLAGLVSRDRRVATLARYLPRSIDAFVSGEDLGRRIEAVGLALTLFERHMFGLVSICVAAKRTSLPRGPEDGPERPCDGAKRSLVAELAL